MTRLGEARNKTLQVLSSRSCLLAVVPRILEPNIHLLSQPMGFHGRLSLWSPASLETYQSGLRNGCSVAQSCSSEAWQVTCSRRSPDSPPPMRAMHLRDADGSLLTAHWSAKASEPATADCRPLSSCHCLPIGT